MRDSHQREYTLACSTPELPNRVNDGEVWSYRRGRRISTPIVNGLYVPSKRKRLVRCSCYVNDRSITCCNGTQSAGARQSTDRTGGSSWLPNRSSGAAGAPRWTAQLRSSRIRLTRHNISTIWARQPPRKRCRDTSGRPPGCQSEGSQHEPPAAAVAPSVPPSP
jgi:hypothetical protein